MKFLTVLVFVHNFENFEKTNQEETEKKKKKKLPSASVRVLPPSPNTCAGHFEKGYLNKKKS